MKTKNNSTQTKPEDKVSRYKRLNPKNYTVVPVEEYLDTSGETKEHWDNLINMLVSLHNIGIFMSIPITDFFIKKGIRYRNSQFFPLSMSSKIIKTKEGKFVLLSYFVDNPDLPLDEMDEIEIIFEYNQNYFGEFIMPVLKRLHERILEERYYAFLYELYFEDAIYHSLHDTWKKIYKEKAKAVKLQKYEDCARLRDEEKKVEQKIQEFLLPKIKEDPKLNCEDFMVYWQLFANNFPESLEL